MCKLVLVFFFVLLLTHSRRARLQTADSHRRLETIQCECYGGKEEIVRRALRFYNFTSDFPLKMTLLYLPITPFDLYSTLLRSKGYS